MSKRLAAENDHGPFTRRKLSSKELRQIHLKMEMANREMRAAESDPHAGVPLPEVPHDLHAKVNDVLLIESDSERDEKRMALADQLDYAVSALSARLMDWKAGKHTEYLNADIEDIESYVALIRAERDRLESGLVPSDQEDSMPTAACFGHSQIEEDREYTYAEAASVLGVKAQTIRKYVSEGRIRARKSGGKGYISGRSIREYRDGRSDTGDEEPARVSSSPKSNDTATVHRTDGLRTIEVPDKKRLKTIIDLLEDLEEEYRGIDLRFERTGTSSMQSFVEQHFHVSGEDPRRTGCMTWAHELSSSVTPSSSSFRDWARIARGSQRGWQHLVSLRVSWVRSKGIPSQQR